MVRNMTAEVEQLRSASNQTEWVLPSSFIRAWDRLLDETKENTVEKLREKNQDLEDKNQEINKTLEETKQRCSKLEGELAATGQALKRALDDSSQSDKLENISGKLLKTEDELNQTNTVLKNARDAESKSKMEVEKLVYRGKAPDEAPVTRRDRQTDGQPLDRTQNPLLPATPASLNDTDANINLNNTNNLNSTAITSPTTDYQNIEVIDS
nr:hypothetical protein BaRGS_006720 [Batillaria attramentaria]